MTQEAVAGHFGISLIEAETLLSSATAEANINDAAVIKRRNKRSDALMKINNRGMLPQFGDDDVFNEFATDGKQFAVLGKTMMAAVRKVSQDQGKVESPTFGKLVPPNLPVPLAPELKALIESALL